MGSPDKWNRDIVCSLEGSVLKWQVVKSQGSRKQVSKRVYSSDVVWK